MNKQHFSTQNSYQRSYLLTVCQSYSTGWHSHTKFLCWSFRFPWTEIRLLRWQVLLLKGVHTQEEEESRQTKSTTETKNKYTKYTSVFITLCKHFVLHFKNATIKLLAHLCTKQITCNACYKALRENTNPKTRNESQIVNIVT